LARLDLLKMGGAGQPCDWVQYALHPPNLGPRVSPFDAIAGKSDRGYTLISRR